MPKVGMEPIRKKELILATIAEIDSTGSLDVTVGNIARRAGMSSGLAHHYFGGKDQLLLATMRHILAIFREAAVRELSAEKTPLERVEAIVRASLHARNFESSVVSAWLSFYVYAQHSRDAQRLLKVYIFRLYSNLYGALRKLMDDETADETARGVGAMIDGFYIRQALEKGGIGPSEAGEIVCQYVYGQIERSNNK